MGISNILNHFVSLTDQRYQTNAASSNFKPATLGDKAAAFFKRLNNPHIQKLGKKLESLRSGDLKFRAGMKEFSATAQKFAARSGASIEAMVRSLRSSAVKEKPDAKIKNQGYTETKKAMPGINHTTRKINDYLPKEASNPKIAKAAKYFMDAKNLKELVKAGFHRGVATIARSVLNSPAGRVLNAEEKETVQEFIHGHDRARFDALFRKNLNSAALKSKLQEEVKKQEAKFSQSGPQPESARPQSQVSQSEKEKIKKQLIGVAIDPKIITDEMMENIDFDGIGRIQGFRKDVQPEMLSHLMANKIKSITEVHSPLAEDIAKSGRGCMVEFMDALKKSNSPVARELIREAKNFWLGGKFNSPSVSQFLGYASTKLAHEPELQKLARKLQNEVMKEKVQSQSYDNVYGRKFDTEFINVLVKNPPAQLLANARKTGIHLINDMEYLARLNPLYHKKFLKALAQHLHEDIRPWAVKTPEVQVFINNPTMHNLRPMLGKVQDGFGAIKIPYLAVKISLAMHTVRAPMPWMAGANYNYQWVIGQSRTTAPGEVVDANRHNGFGLRLHHHPKNEATPEFQNGRNWTTQKKAELSNLSGFEANALANEKPLVNGTSGSTNIMSYLNDYISRRDPTFSKDLGALNTMMFVVYDGGHSVNEVMAVHDTLEKMPDFRFNTQHYAHVIEERKRLIANYSVDYNDVIKLGLRDGSSAEIRRALDMAMEKTVNSYVESRSSR